MSSFLTRIKVIADREGLSVTAFETAIGASRGVFTRAMNNNTDVQAKWLISIVEKFPEYSSDWLLKGEGDMLKPPLAQDEGEPYVAAGAEGAVINSLKKVISSQDVTIKSQEKTIISLERLLSSLEREIEALRNK
ncbi:hypothetical protein ACR78Z_23620 [Sphingobacterium thalpophilum]|uniref:HTH cro/C1-type domain-containing protein n=1 Tax=Sphingobacterium thalpophilum TaxID=259 RepID=A0A4U9UU92_9SPHI|nr:hypothetical protein [Sphingobacterium thalpophilum]VTR37490.1 Uncharacterised protein [Sphingobacterium thalpophilum]